MRARRRWKNGFLTLLEVQRLGEVVDGFAAEGVNNKALNVMRLRALTGSRRDEIAGLTWDEIPISGNCLSRGDSEGRVPFAFDPERKAVILPPAINPAAARSASPRSLSRRQNGPPDRRRRHRDSMMPFVSVAAVQFFERGNCPTHPWLANFQSTRSLGKTSHLCHLWKVSS